MDERGRVLLTVLGCGLGSALLGALFGGLTGVVHWRAGNASGSWVGLAVASAFERAGRRELSPTVKGALVGGVDGIVFLGFLGALIGLGYVLLHPGREAFLGIGLLALCLLMLGAVGFGFLAYAMIAIGVRAGAGACVVALLGMRGGWEIGGTAGLLAGGLLGLVIGVLVALVWFSPRDTGSP